MNTYMRLIEILNTAAISRININKYELEFLIDKTTEEYIDLMLGRGGYTTPKASFGRMVYLRINLGPVCSCEAVRWGVKVLVNHLPKQLLNVCVWC